MTNWTNIDPGFTAELKNEWEKRGFSYQTVKEWTGIGFKIDEYRLVYFVQNVLGYSAEIVLNNSDLETLRLMYQENLKAEDSQIEEAMHQSLLISPTDVNSEEMELQKILLSPQSKNVPNDWKEKQIRELNEEVSHLKRVINEMGKLPTPIFSDNERFILKDIGEWDFTSSNNHQDLIKKLRVFLTIGARYPIREATQRFINFLEKIELIDGDLIDSLIQKLSKKGQELQAEKVKNQSLLQQLKDLLLKDKNSNLNELIELIKKELSELHLAIEINLNEEQKSFLEDLLIAQKQLVLLEGSSKQILSLTERQLNKANQSLLRGGVNAEQLGLLCQAQKELTKLEMELEQQTETHILVLPRRN